jgi:hypothetical protein
LNAKVKWLLSIILLIIVALVVWSRDAILAALAKWHSGPGAPPAAETKFPVCINSSDVDIKAAFIASGMMDAFKASWTAGSYNGAYPTWASLETKIFSDVHGWLANHPYLYGAYPEYFIVP